MTHDVWTGAAAAEPRSGSLRLPPQVRPVDRTHSSAGALTDRSGVEAAQGLSKLLLPRTPLDAAIDWVQNHSFFPTKGTPFSL
jgi:hypothetical protein